MKREFQYEVNGEIITVTVESAVDGYVVHVAGRTYRIEAHPGDRGRIDMATASQRVRAYVASDGARRYVGLDGATWTLDRPDPRRRPASPGSSGGGSLTATMPGLVLDVLVHAGDVVRKGETLVLMEAMKMELRITAPQDGNVAHVNCRAGEVVQRGQLLIELE